MDVARSSAITYALGGLRASADKALGAAHNIANTSNDKSADLAGHLLTLEQAGQEYKANAASLKIIRALDKTLLDIKI